MVQLVSESGILTKFHTVYVTLWLFHNNNNVLGTSGPEAITKTRNKVKNMEGAKP
jgi:hypothetical protein